jgi:hypothetical protein
MNCAQSQVDAWTVSTDGKAENTSAKRRLKVIIFESDFIFAS